MNPMVFVPPNFSSTRLHSFMLTAYPGCAWCGYRYAIAVSFVLGNMGRDVQVTQRIYIVVDAVVHIVARALRCLLSIP